MLIQPNETHFFREMSKGYFNLNMHNTTTTTTRYDFPHWITWQNVSLKMFLLPISTTKKGNVIVHSSSNNNVCKYLVKNSCSAFPFNSNQLRKTNFRSLWKKKFNIGGKNTIVKPNNYHFLGILGFNYLLKFWIIAGVVHRWR